MRNSILILSLSISVISCGTESEKSNSEVQAKTEIKTDSTSNGDSSEMTDSIKDVMDTPLFDMHPYPDYSEPYNAIPKSANIKYFEGNIGDNEISICLEQNRNTSKWSGKYIYISNGTMFDLEVDFESENDTIYYYRKKEGITSETFITTLDSIRGNYSGIWIKGTDTLNCNFSPVITTDEQRQLFINLANGSFYNSTDEILVNTDDIYDSGTGNFAQSYSKDQMGSAYNFGEEWTVTHQKILFKEDKIIFVNLTNNNETSTVFVEGKEPGGPEDEDYEVAGMEYNSNNLIAYQVIINGIIEEGEITLNYDFNSEIWFLDDYILIQLSRDSEQGELIKYKWDDSTNEFVLVN